MVKTIPYSIRKEESFEIIFLFECNTAIALFKGDCGVFV